MEQIEVFIAGMCKALFKDNVNKYKCIYGKCVYYEKGVKCDMYYERLE